MFKSRSMIDIRELRIGNIVEHLSLGKWKIGQVLGVHISEEVEYRGVPLTEEWLEKFGLEKMSNYYEWRGIDAHLDFKITQQFLVFNRWFNPVRDTPLQYVHQLQNLYFALTGEELTVNQEV